MRDWKISFVVARGTFEQEGGVVISNQKNQIMGVNQILELVKRLPYVEQLTIAEAILHSIVEQERGAATFGDDDAKLSIAAEALYEDYRNDEELTIFTQLDGEAIHEEK